MNSENKNSSVETARGTQRPRFSILHTSARPQAWRAVYDAWLAAADRPEDVEYILVADERWGFTPKRDEGGYELVHQMSRVQDKLVWNTGRRCYVEGVNLAAKHAIGDILIVVADDQFPCEHWDTEIDAAMQRHIVNRLDAFVFWAPTGTPSEFERAIIVMPIMSRALYEKWGYVLYPGYESMYSDNDLCEHAKAEGVLVEARHLPIFPHKHYLFTPGVQIDQAYQEQNRSEAYEFGEALLNVRRENGFKDVNPNPPTPIRVLENSSRRPSIQPCIPGETFSRDWVMAWTSLLFVISERFRLLPPITGYSSAPHVTRQGIREEILRGELPDFVLWLDDDNLLSPDGLLQLYVDMVEHPQIQLAAGWSWDSIGKSITAGLQQPDGTFGRIEHKTLMDGPHDLFKIDWTGFPAVLMRGSLLVDAGPMAFIPMPTGPPYYLMGEDISFCMRVKDQLKVVDRRVRVPSPQVEGQPTGSGPRSKNRTAHPELAGGNENGGHSRIERRNMATINYLYPVAGSVPSSHASQTANLVMAQIVMTDLDTTAVITHNFLSSQIFPPNAVTDLASGFPIPAIYYTSPPTTTLANALGMVVGTNILTITKVAQVGSAFTGVLSISRPQTATR